MCCPLDMFKVQMNLHNFGDLHLDRQTDRERERARKREKQRGRKRKLSSGVEQKKRII